MYVNSEDESIYIGSSTNLPIKMVTALNIESYVKEYAGSGGDEPTVPPDLPDKSNLVLGNTFTWGAFQWVVVHVDNAAQECYLAVNDNISSYGSMDFSELNAQNNAIASVYLTEGQRAALKYIVAGTTSGRVFSPTEEQVVNTFDYYRTSKSNRIWGRVTWWMSTATKYVNNIGDIVQSTGEKANTTRPHCCIDMSLYDSQGGGGSELNPELPDKSSLTLGNNITWADQQWIVSHVTGNEAYLTLKGLSGYSPWNDLHIACTNFAQSLTEAQRECLKNVTAGNTYGKVFVATEFQMEGEFDYFRGSDSRRALDNYETYWTSTEFSGSNAYFVDSDGSFSYGGYKSQSYGFRPSVCIDLTLYNT